MLGERTRPGQQILVIPSLAGQPALAILIFVPLAFRKGSTFLLRAPCIAAFPFGRFWPCPSAFCMALMNDCQSAADSRACLQRHPKLLERLIDAQSQAAIARLAEFTAGSVLGLNFGSCPGATCRILNYRTVQIRY